MANVYAGPIRIEPLPIPLETWDEIIRFIARSSLARSTSLVSLFFNATSRKLIDNGDNHVIDHMEFRFKRYGRWKQSRSPQLFLRSSTDFRRKKCEIGSIPAPKRILGFTWIDVRYFDPTILQFFHSIRHLLANGVHLTIEPPILMFNCLNSPHVRQLIGWMNVLSINIRARIFEQFLGLYPELMSNVRHVRINQGLKEEHLDMLINWLSGEGNGADGDGEKVLELSDRSIALKRQMQDRLVKLFETSTRPWPTACTLKYMTFLWQPHFQMVNSITREHLHLWLETDAMEEELYHLNLRRFLPSAAQPIVSNIEKISEKGGTPPTPYGSIRQQIVLQILACDFNENGGNIA